MSPHVTPMDYEIEPKFGILCQIGSYKGIAYFGVRNCETTCTWEWVIISIRVTFFGCGTCAPLPKPRTRNCKCLPLLATICNVALRSWILVDWFLTKRIPTRAAVVSVSFWFSMRGWLPTFWKKGWCFSFFDPNTTVCIIKLSSWGNGASTKYCFKPWTKKATWENWSPFLRLVMGRPHVHACTQGTCWYLRCF